MSKVTVDTALIGQMIALAESYAHIARTEPMAARADYMEPRRADYAEELIRELDQVLKQANDTRSTGKDENQNSR